MHVSLQQQTEGSPERQTFLCSTGAEVSVWPNLIKLSWLQPQESQEEKKHSYSYWIENLYNTVNEQGGEKNPNFQYNKIHETQIVHQGILLVKLSCIS